MDAITDDYRWTAETSFATNYVSPVVLDLVRELKPGSILDVGCGNGSLAALLADSGYDVTGVDGDSGGIAIARARNSEAKFEVCRFADNPPGLFDVVISTEVVEHLYDPDELIAYCRKALNPGGHLIITTPYHGYLKNLALAVGGKMDHHFNVYNTGGHIKFFSRKTLTALLAKHGFAVTGFRGAGRLPYLWKSMVLLAKRA